MNARDLEHKARKAGCHVETGGRHPKIVTPSGAAVPFPKHRGDLPPGTLSAIVKMLRAAGVVLALVAAVATHLAGAW